MSEPLTTDNCQIIYCAVCLELQDLNVTPQMAITVVDGTAACEEHRRRVRGYDNAVRGARRFHQQDGPPRGPRRDARAPRGD